jgi:hypothetical protein
LTFQTRTSTPKSLKLCSGLALKTLHLFWFCHSTYLATSSNVLSDISINTPSLKHLQYEINLNQLIDNFHYFDMLLLITSHFLVQLLYKKSKDDLIKIIYNLKHQ